MFIATLSDSLVSTLFQIADGETDYGVDFDAVDTLVKLDLVEYAPSPLQYEFDWRLTHIGAGSLESYSASILEGRSDV